MKEATDTIRAAIKVLSAVTEQDKALELEVVHARFRDGARSIARGAAMGLISPASFVFQLSELILTWFPEAFMAGMATCGVEIDVITEAEPAEQNTVITEVQTDLASAQAFAVDIANERYGAAVDLVGVGPTAAVFVGLLARVELYAVRLNHFFALGQTAACGNQMMIWELGPTKDHCADCLFYNGQRHRMNTWERHGAITQSHDLECGGWRCKCRQVPTTGKATGRLRSPGGL